MLITDKHILPRKGEIILGIVFFILGAYLMYMAYPARGKDMRWPMGAVMPF